MLNEVTFLCCCYACDMMVEPQQNDYYCAHTVTNRDVQGIPYLEKNHYDAEMVLHLHNLNRGVGWMKCRDYFRCNL